MKSLKQILKHRGVHLFLVRLVALYIRLVFFTSRKRIEIHPEAAPYMNGEANAIFAFWHGRMLLIPPNAPPRRIMHILISQHRDGIFISDVMSEFGFKTIAGSTSKNARGALMAMLRALKNGENIAITPDGPRGPSQVAAQGVASAAKLSGKPVIPVTFSSAPHKRARSWDRFMVALPFSRIIFCAAAPIMIDKEADDEESRLAIERVMNQQTEQADAAIL